MFPNNNNNNSNTPSTSEIIGINGIPKPKSLLSSFMFSRLSSPVGQQQQQQQQHRSLPSSSATTTKTTGLYLPSSLQSSMLPSCLNDTTALRSRAVTDDTTTTDKPTTSSNSNSSAAALLLPRPRRPWNISNVDDRKALPKVPEFYPPFNSNCTALVTDAPPSIVVVRISECLRRRSIAVEYDDESVTARCMTVDRTHFVIQLYRPSSTSSTSTSTSTSLPINNNKFDGGDNDNDHDMAMCDFQSSSSSSAVLLTTPSNDAVIVEVQRTSSDIMSFHAACYKILMAAKGLDAGNDERQSRHMNGMEFRLRRPKSISSKRSCYHSNSPTSSSSRDMMKRRKLPPSDNENDEAHHSVYESNSRISDNNNNKKKKNTISEEALEGAFSLLQKDRWDCQQLGMESLVNLTTWDIVGKETCLYISRCLLQQQQQQQQQQDRHEDGDDEGVESSSSNRWRLIDCLMHPGAEQASEFEHEVGEGRQGYTTTTTTTTKNRCRSAGNTIRNDRMVRSFLESSALSAVTPSQRKHNSQNHQRQQSLSSSVSRGQSFLKKKASSSMHHRRSPSSANIDESRHRLQQKKQQQLDKDPLSPDELRHEARLRSMALRVFCNALDNLSRTKELQQILHPNVRNSQNSKKTNNDRQQSRWVRPAFLMSLVQDLQGAGRPPSVSETGYKLASVHEAALAVRCLRLLAGYSGDSDEEEDDSFDNYDDNDDYKEQEDVRDFLRSEAVLERLEYARSYGRVNHTILQYEAERTYNRLTEDVRSC